MILQFLQIFRTEALTFMVVAVPGPVPNRGGRAEYINMSAF